MTAGVPTPPIEATIDMIGTIGFTTGLVAAIWFQWIRHEPIRFWMPFIPIAFVFALFAGEGGLLDPYPPGTLRIVALLVLLAVELFAVWAVTHPINHR